VTPASPSTRAIPRPIPAAPVTTAVLSSCAISRPLPWVDWSGMDRRGRRNASVRRGSPLPLGGRPDKEVEVPMPGEPADTVVARETIRLAFVAALSTCRPASGRC
jgi:hypothetical protein